MEKRCSNCAYHEENWAGPHCNDCFLPFHSNWEERKLPSPPADYLDCFRYFPKFSLPIFKNDAIIRIDTDSIKVNKEDNMNNKPRNHKFIKTNTKERKIKEVMFNGPATIIKWEPTMHDYAYGKTKSDKTVSVCGEGDIYDKEKGFLLAVIKEFVDNQSYDNILRMMDSFNDDQKGIEEKNEEKNEEFNHKEFYNFLLNTIQPNEMEKYRNMFLSSGEIMN